MIQLRITAPKFRKRNFDHPFREACEVDVESFGWDSDSATAAHTADVKTLSMELGVL